MNTFPYKGKDWPVTEGWAERHLAGAFAEFTGWATGTAADEPGAPGLWGRLWAILRKSDQTLAERTAGMSHADIKAAMEDPDRRAAILDVLTPAEFRELRAVEAHIIVRNRVDHLLGRELAEFDIQYIDHAHGQGCATACGCELMNVMDDAKLSRLHAGEEGLTFMHPHYPRKLCARHAHLQSVVDALGRWHNTPLGERLAYVHEVILSDRGEAADVAAVA